MKLQIVIDGQAYEVEIDFADGLPPSNLPGSATLHSSVVATIPRSASPQSGVDESKVCRSPVAGIVAQVVARSGQEVKLGDLLIVLEAMKMETKVTATGAATVKAILVAPGEAVKLKQILVEFQ